MDTLFQNTKTLSIREHELVPLLLCTSQLFLYPTHLKSITSFSQTQVITMIFNIRIITLDHSILFGMRSLMCANLVHHTHNQNETVHRLLFLPITLKYRQYFHQLFHPATFHLVILPTYQIFFLLSTSHSLGIDDNNNERNHTYYMS